MPDFRLRFASLLLLVLPWFLGACASSSTFTQSGQASYYADKFNGRETASGTVYRPGRLTAAHNTLPFGTVVRVTNPRNNRSVKVTVTDRGPHAKGRIIDLSRKAARKIGIMGQGVAPVKLKVVHAAR
ncbi:MULTISPECIES: septal ring lytic transglycosylase RlpA family protein [Hymenobacter]|uniref:Probable endolytic peptidoglycan transglycosylase RlpA n=1 Tax=Hymenobacter jejuensis TaxID=2502781 RepID=A0A5B7ZYC9_9BACT|nr:MULTISPECIES: septal ring lytic transglycosylase RlpA family protein [Hymenobacter]MBC6991880.1 septal ring lytic transglycosylase RlpA family protein [Hymenobacter sp. BT491]QDA60194.1 septal ring lytic transglycosylase RlpA family protein [Hymenobacter jejuensis]